MNRWQDLGCVRGLRCTVFGSMVVAAAFLLAGITGGVQAQEIEFIFNPPDSITFTQTFTNTKIQNMGSQGTRTEITESIGEITIKRAPSGFIVTNRPISITMSRDGVQMANPLFDLFNEMTITYELDSLGQIQTVTGYETLMEKMQKVFPPAAVQSLLAMINEESMINKEIAEWNGRIGDYVGQTVEIGDDWTSESPFPLPTGEEITFYSLTTFTGWAECDDHDCLRITFSYNSDADALAKAAGEMVKDLAKDSVTVSDSLASSIVGEGERLIDPATMLLYAETITRTMTMPLEVPEQGIITVTTQETRKSTFDYSKK